MLQLVKNFSRIASLYDIFIFDIYGVIHNGIKVLHPVLECLENLIRQEKQVILVTNAPQSHVMVQNRLDALGVSRDLYHQVITAGDVTHHHLARQLIPFSGTCCLIIGQELFPNILERTPYTQTGDITRASFILNLGPDQEEHLLSDYYDILQKAGALKLPMICGNPDLSVYKGDREELRAGGIAHYYMATGGYVQYYGKPYEEIYRKALQPVAIPAHARVLAIGDSFITDYTGARKMGFDVCICFGVLSARETSGKTDDFNRISPAQWLSRIEMSGYSPEYIAFERLRW